MLVGKLLVATTTQGLLFSCTSSFAFSSHHQRRTAISTAFRHLSITRSATTTARLATQPTFSHLMSTASEEDSVATTNNSRVALLQFQVTESKAQNHATAREFLSRAAAQRANMAILPEIWNSPYATCAFPEYAEILPDVGDSLNNDDTSDATTSTTTSTSARLLMELAREHNMYIVGGSVPERVVSNSKEDDLIYNTCLCINPEGIIVAKHRKTHLFDIDVPGKITFKESDTLSPGTGMTTFDAGDPFGMVGVGICYDIRFPELSLCLVERGCRILIFPGAFNLTTGPAHWELLQRARAVDGQCYVLTASPARSSPPTEDDTSKKYPHYSAWGHSTAVSPWGDVLATCDEKEHVVIVDLDMDKVEEMRAGIPTMTQKRTDLYTVVDVKK